MLLFYERLGRQWCQVACSWVGHIFWAIQQRVETLISLCYRLYIPEVQMTGVLVETVVVFWVSTF